MRATYLEQADQAAVSHVVQEVLHKEGALVSDHSSSRVLFRGYRPSGKYTWDRGGYVGIYQHAGEEEVEVRLRLRARWPWRLLWSVALVNVVAVLATIVLNPSGTVWFGVATLGAFGLLSAGVLYINTWKPVRREERALMDTLETAFTKGFGIEDLESMEAREARAQQERLAGEVERLRVKEARKAEAPERRGLSLPRPKFNLARKKAPAQETEGAEDAEAKRARLEQLRAQVAARRAQAPVEDAAAEEAPAQKRRFGLPKLALPSIKLRKEKGADAPPEDESPEERRARLLARKAELEAQRRDEE